MDAFHSPISHSGSGLKSKSMQNVKYDSTTGKMYEELGAAASNNTSNLLGPSSSSGASNVDLSRATADYLNYQSYQSYPYSQVSQVNYMGSFAATGYSTGSHQLNPYDRYKKCHKTSSPRKPRFEQEEVLHKLLMPFFASFPLQVDPCIPITLRVPLCRIRP